MIRLYPDQLPLQLRKQLHRVYLLLGNDKLLLQDSQNIILHAAKNRGFEKHYAFQIDNNTNWQTIFTLCQTRDLFTVRQIIQIFLPENSFNAIINKQLTILIDILHSDLLLIIQGNNLTKLQKQSIWFNKLTKCSVIVNCQILEHPNIMHWVIAKAKQYNLHLDDEAKQLLCYCYEGNLTALTQTLKILILLWPNEKITFSRVEQVVNDVARFSPMHWIDSLLSAKGKRALHILRKLHLENINPMILLRILQRELLLLMFLKRNMHYSESRSTFFDKNQIYYKRRTLISRAIGRLDQDQIRQAIQLLTRIEVNIKQNCCEYSTWYDLKNISLLICYKAIDNNFIDHHNEIIFQVRNTNYLR